MSDGITEARRGTYFGDRSKPKPTERELIEKRLDRIRLEMDDLKWEKQELETQLKKLNEKTG